MGKSPTRLRYPYHSPLDLILGSLPVSPLRKIAGRLGAPLVSICHPVILWVCEKRGIHQTNHCFFREVYDILWDGVGYPLQHQTIFIYIIYIIYIYMILYSCYIAIVCSMGRGVKKSILQGTSRTSISLS